MRLHVFEWKSRDWSTTEVAIEHAEMNGDHGDQRSRRKEVTGERRSRRMELTETLSLRFMDQHCGLLLFGK